MNIAIVEDQKKDADILTEYLNKFFSENGEDCIINYFTDGIKFMTNYKHIYDIVFMDIQMPDMDGMSIAAKLREIDDSVCLVFVTNMRQYAVKGYEVDAIDFIVKPVTYDVFRFKLSRIVRIAEKTKNAEILISTKNEKRRIKIHSIDYVEVLNHKCIYHLSDEDVESWDSLANIYEVLSKYNFCYCNSCYLVNLSRVTGVEDNIAIVRNVKLTISRPKRKEFLNKLSLSISGG